MIFSLFSKVKENKIYMIFVKDPFWAQEYENSVLIYFFMNSSNLENKEGPRFGLRSWTIQAFLSFWFCTEKVMQKIWAYFLRLSILYG